MANNVSQRAQDTPENGRNKTIGCITPFGNRSKKANIQDCVLCHHHMDNLGILIITHCPEHSTPLSLEGKRQKHLCFKM